MNEDVKISSVGTIDVGDVTAYKYYGAIGIVALWVSIDEMEGIEIDCHVSGGVPSIGLGDQSDDGILMIQFDDFDGWTIWSSSRSKSGIAICLIQDFEE